MTRVVNGLELDLPDLELDVRRLPDRLLVHTQDGVFSALVVRRGDTALVSFKGRQFTVAKQARRSASASDAASGELRAPMPGVVVAVNVEKGSNVKKGDTVLVIEAMKTQQPFLAPFDAVVTDLTAVKGKGIAEGELLAILESRADN